MTEQPVNDVVYDHRLYYDILFSWDRSEEALFFCADMTRFSADGVYGAAYNPMSSFRMLFPDAEAEAHLRAVSQSLRRGGVYVWWLAIAWHRVKVIYG